MFKLFYHTMNVLQTFFSKGCNNEKTYLKYKYNHYTTVDMKKFFEESAWFITHF